ncbi:hypothetical protein PG993_008128 [Apiospora rasikravindrae]|uniref:Rhodopsin domain-containing protein n=1 Tax=Apiospora rasikravindrae TaxID=990691 RepID=A0ABR1SZG1_9PEZI
MPHPTESLDKHPSTARVDRDTLLVSQAPIGNNRERRLNLADYPKGAIWSLTGVAVLLVVARLSIRLRYSHRRLLADDYLAILALFILIGNSAVMTLMSASMYEVIAVSAGAVAPPPPSFLDDATYYLELQFASTVLFWSCLWAVKGCFLVLFGRLARPLKWPRRAWIAIVVFTVAAYCASIVTYPLVCPSLQLSKKSTAPFRPLLVFSLDLANHTPQVECQGPLNIYRSAVSLRFSTAVDVVSDVLIICLPVYLTVGLQMSPGQKAGLVAVLSLGGIVAVFAVVRVVVTGDATRLAEISWLALWSAVESSVAVVVACLASFKVLFTQKKKRKGTQYYTRTKGTRTTKSYKSKSLTSGSGGGGPQVAMPDEAELDDFTIRNFSRKALVARAVIVEVGARTASQERILNN